MSQETNSFIKKFIYEVKKEKREENEEEKEEKEEEKSNIYKFDDSKELLEKEENLNNLINFRFANINIYYSKEKEEIMGIQITYRNKKENMLIPLIRRTGNEYPDNQKRERFKFNKDEHLMNFSFRRLGTKLTQINIETNRHRKFVVGKDIGDLFVLKKEDKSDIILATFGTLINMGIYYLRIQDYIRKYYTGLSELKKKIEKDEEYKKQLEQNYQNFSEVDKYIYRTALLPNTPFTSILKYIISELKY